MAGKLIVIATPLGNLDDLSPRGLEALREADLVACEDTRRSSRLLARFGVRSPLVACHRFNEPQRAAELVEHLLAGKRVALLTDSGTPAVSDPGSWIVRAAVEAGIAVSPIPGPSAVTALLSVSGFGADRFVFDGFLPHRAGERRRRLRELRSERRTIVIFETPHRILVALKDIDRIFGERPMVLGRELSKLHESILFGTASRIAEQLDRPVRGEMTLALQGATDAEDEVALDVDAERTLAAWRAALAASGGDRRVALRTAARTLAIKKAELQRALAELGVDG